MYNKYLTYVLLMALSVGVINGVESTMLSLKMGNSLSNLEPKLITQAIEFLCKAPDNDDTVVVQNALNSEDEFKEIIGPRICTKLWNWDLFLFDVDDNQDSAAAVKILCNRYINLLIGDIRADVNMPNPAFKLGQMYIAVRMRQLEDVVPVSTWIVNNVLTTDGLYDAFIRGIVKQGNITRRESIAFKKLPEIFKVAIASHFKE